MYQSDSQQDHEDFYSSRNLSHIGASSSSRRSFVQEKRHSGISRTNNNPLNFYDDDSGDDAESQSYFSMGSSDTVDEQLRRALSMMVGSQQGGSTRQNFTMPIKKKKMNGDVMQTFMACQNCGEVSTKSKQLQCSHIICYKCAMSLRSQHLDPGQWMLRCVTCNLITTWYGNKLEGLHDNAPVNNLRKQSSGMSSSKRILQEKEGQITMYGDKDLTINIVSFAKEKAEAKKALANAEKRMKACHQRMKVIKEYEKKVKDTKLKMKKQMQRAAEGYIAAIKTQHAHMSKELDVLFTNDLKPVQEAKATVESHMHSLKLIVQCCSVADRILENGGAPFDLDNFKRMVWETMNQTNHGKLPETLKKTYKANINFKSNEDQFEELAEKMGELVFRKQKKKEEPVKAMPKPKPRVPTPCSSETEEIYDLPPELEEKMKSLMKKEDNEDEEDELYDEIPFSSEMLMENEGFDSNAPPPIPKNTLMEMSNMISLPPPPSTTIINPDFNFEIQTDPSNLINPQNTRNFDSRSSFLNDTSDEEPICKPIPTTRSRIGSTRSRASGYRSTRESRSRPGSPMLQARRKSCGVTRDFEEERYFEEDTNSKYSTMLGYETQPEYQSNGTISRLIKRRKSLKSLGSLSDAVQQFLGKSETALNGLNSERLLFCVGKIKKPGTSGSLIQPFNCAPEIALSEDDTVWIADSASSRIQIHEGVNGRVVGSFKTTLQGVALKPRGITSMAGGRKVAVSCGRFATVWSEGGELLRQVGPHSDFGKLGGLATDVEGSLILSDVENNRIVFTGNEKIIHNAVTGINNSGKSPWAGRIAVNSFDQVICPDYGSHCIRIYNSAGHFMTKFGRFGVGPEQFRYPCAVAVDSQNRIYVADECNNRISLYSPDGEDWLGHVITKEDGLVFPHAVCVFSDGAVGVADDNKVVKVYRGKE